MKDDRAASLASAIVVGTGAIWGFYWLPVRQLAEAGLPGAWGTLAAVTVALVLMLPAAFHRRAGLQKAPFSVLFYTALGGGAFALYSVALLYGRVAIIILLFYLTPVWSTLIARYVMGWRTPPARVLAMALGLAGLAIMLSANGELPFPRTIGEWFGLLSGVLWSVSSTGIRSGSGLRAMEAGFAFALGACAAALVLVPVLAPLPQDIALGPAVGWGLAAGGLWWTLSMTALMWATARLEPTRVGILLMSEVLVGAISGALLAGETLGAVEIAGGALVLVAAVLEIGSARKAPGRRTLLEP